MRAPLNLGFTAFLGLLVLGCTGGTDDTGWWVEPVDDTGPRSTSEYFEPVGFFVEVYASYQGDRLEQFILDPNDPASALPPVMFITLAEGRYFSTWDDAYTCSWFGEVIVQGINLLDDPEMWVGFAIGLKFLDSDCNNMDPWVWGSSSPTTVLESASLGIGFRPMSTAFEGGIRHQVVTSGMQWERDWEPYVFTMAVGIWDEETGRLDGTEVDYAFSYKMEDGALAYDFAGNPIPLGLEAFDGLPQGLLAGYPYYNLELSRLR
jgi:hypothetical protein